MKGTNQPCQRNFLTFNFLPVVRDSTSSILSQLSHVSSPENTNNLPTVKEYSLICRSIQGFKLEMPVVINC